MSRANDHPTYHPYSLPPTFIRAILEYLLVIAHAAAGSYIYIYMSYLVIAFHVMRSLALIVTLNKTVK